MPHALLKQLGFNDLMLIKVSYSHRITVTDVLCKLFLVYRFFCKYLAFVCLERLQLPFFKKKDDDGFSCMCFLKGNPLSVVENI